MLSSDDSRSFPNITGNDPSLQRNKSESFAVYIIVLKFCNNYQILLIPNTSLTMLFVLIYLERTCKEPLASWQNYILNVIINRFTQSHEENFKVPHTMIWDSWSHIDWEALGHALRIKKTRVLGEAPGRAAIGSEATTHACSNSDTLAHLLTTHFWLLGLKFL
jgi:hypothetical protein